MGQYSVRSEQWTTVDTLAEQPIHQQPAERGFAHAERTYRHKYSYDCGGPLKSPPPPTSSDPFLFLSPLLSHVRPRSERAPAPRISSRQQDSTLFVMLVTARIVGACAPLSPLTTRTRPKPPECVTRRTHDTASHHVRPFSMPSKPAAKMGAKCK